MAPRGILPPTHPSNPALLVQGREMHSGLGVEALGEQWWVQGPESSQDTVKTSQVTETIHVRGDALSWPTREVLCSWRQPQWD